jgi:mannose-6-phosphate isomerase-like protein (cupin superfamily)
MARVIGMERAEAAAALELAGVRLHRTDPGGDAPADVVASVLPEGARHIRAEVDIDVPEDADSGMGAWHVNDVDEVHVVASGEGIMEFVTLDGIVSVVVESGDVVEIRGAEHRYRPLSPQHWRLRFGGAADQELVATATGRASGHWPAP